MDKNKIAITLGIVCFILTASICVQINTVKSTNSTVAQTFTENNLRDEVLKWKEKYDNISNDLNNAEKELAKIRENSTKNDSSSSAKEAEITLNNNLLGKTDLMGQGIEMTLKDDPDATRESIGVFDDISDHIIHDADLRYIVNELKNAGAEAISVNGERIVSTSYISVVDYNRILIDEKRITSPYEIKAIGDKKYLESMLTIKGGFKDRFEKQLKIEYTLDDNVIIPAYGKEMNKLQYSQEYKEQEAN